jgi:hypothetical protein
MQLHCSRVVASAVGLVSMIGLAIFLSGREPGSPRSTISLPQDWSHRHVVFSNPATLEQSIRVKQDARFWQQSYRRNVRQSLPAEDSSLRDSREPHESPQWFDADWFGWFNWFHRRPRKPAPTPRNPLKRDWAISLGPNATVGAGNYPAKFSFDITTANCASAAQPDFVVFNTGVGTSGQASIVAYDNLYSGCSGGVDVPTTYWAYNTGGAVVTSVTLSVDGSQVAFVQTPTLSTHANLVLLKWQPTADGAVSTNPDPINIVTASAYPTCTLPCMTTLPFSGTANDTLSSPFYDYFNDALYVGDDTGSLHKFQPVFTTGTPAEVATGWPVLLATGLKLSSPVYDSVTGRVFVGSSWNGTTGSKLYAVTASTGILAATSAALGKGNGIAAGPIVDSTAGKVYVFLGTDNSPSGTCVGGGPCSGVYQFTASSALATSVEATVQRGSNSFTFTLNTGTFDNAYYTSSNSTGNLYVCGNSLGTGILYQVPVSAGTMSTTSAAGPQLAGTVGLGANGPCSTVTEIFNPNVGGALGTDRIFVGTNGTGSGTCSSGCIYDMPVNSWQPLTSYALGEEITDKFLNVQVVTTPGTSGSGTPSWSSPGNITPDGTVTWRCKEGLGTTTFGTWQAHTGYSVGSAVLDTNGNVEVQQDAGAMSGASQPSWSLAIGGTASDDTANWVNVGPPDNFVLAVTGGTSGMVVDNFVTAGTLAGGSQVYFTPLGLGFSTCGTGNGCAVQASQAGLN